MVHISFLFMIATHKRKRLKSTVYVTCSQKKTQRLCVMCGCESYHELSRIKVHVCVLSKKATCLCDINIHLCDQ